MKRILIILIVIIGLLAGGGYFLVLEALKPSDVPAKVLNAENAIASAGTIAISSIDISHVRRIDDMFKGIKDPSPISVPKKVEPKQAKTLLEKLKKQGVNLYSTTNYALATINIANKKPAYSFVLFGNYSQAKLKQAIQQTHLVEKSANGYLLITENVEEQIKNDPCAVPTKKSSIKQHALHIQNDRILLSSPEMMTILLKRLASNAQAGVSLTKWRAFRKDKVMAAAFMSPKEAKKGATDLPSAMLLGAISSQPLNEMYAGAVVSLLPSPGFKFLVDAYSTNTEWPLKVKTKYDAWLAETLSELKGMPTLATLFNSLNVQADGNILRLSTTADKKTLDNIGKLPGEFLKMAFSGAFGGGEKEGHTGAEQIVKNSEIEKYVPHFDFSSVQPFDGKNVFYKSDYVAGPFGVRLKKIGLLATDDSIIELNINVEGKGFENLSGELMHKSDELPAASLFVTSVEDKEGNNLLREELCGKKRNLVASQLTSSRDKEYIDDKWISKSLKISGDKGVRLKQLVLLSQVANIKGKVAVRAATQTNVKTLKHPFAKKTIETSKVRMYLKKSSLSTVKYDLSGDMNRILAVRAKNEKGDYLASSGSSASSYEGIKTVSKRFKGKVVSIEVVVAEQMKSEEYPFELTQLIPRYGKKENGKQVGVSFTSKKRFLREHAKVKYTNECKDKQKVRAGAFLICLNKFGKQWGQEIGGEFEVIGPAEEALQNDLSAGMLSIDTVVTEDGKKISFNKKVPVNFDYKFDTKYNDKKKKWQITNRRLQASYVKILTDNEKLKDKKISMINGTLTIRIPKKAKHIVLGADELGIAKKSKDGITVSIAGFEDWSTYIDIKGSVHKVMRMMPLAKDGTILNTGNDRINEKKYQTWGMSKEDKEKIEALPKKWQGMITIYGKPEKIRIFYANDFDVIKRKFQLAI